jgi:hypothetical protein
MTSTKKESKKSKQRTEKSVVSSAKSKRKLTIQSKSGLPSSSTRKKGNKPSKKQLSTTSAKDTLQTTPTIKTSSNKQITTSAKDTLQTTPTIKTSTNKKITYSTPKNVALVEDSYEEQVECHRRAFNCSVFNFKYNEKGEAEIPELTSKSAQFTDSKYQQTIDILSNWNQEDKEAQGIYRQAHHLGYHLTTRYDILEIRKQHGKREWLLQRQPQPSDKKETGRLILPMSKIFDAISDAHGMLAHLKANPTHKEIQKK